MQIFPKIIRSDGQGDYPALNDVEFTIDEKRLLALQKILSSDIWNFHCAYFYPPTVVVNKGKDYLLSKIPSPGKLLDLAWQTWNADLLLFF